MFEFMERVKYVFVYSINVTKRSNKKKTSGPGKLTLSAVWHQAKNEAKKKTLQGTVCFIISISQCNFYLKDSKISTDRKTF